MIFKSNIINAGKYAILALRRNHEERGDHATFGRAGWHHPRKNYDPKHFKRAEECLKSIEKGPGVR